MDQINRGLIGYQQGVGSAIILPNMDLKHYAHLNDSNLARHQANQKAAQQEQTRQLALRQKLLDTEVDPPALRDVKAVGDATAEMRDYVANQLASGNDNVLRAGTTEWQKLQELKQRAVWGAKQSKAEAEWLQESVQHIRTSNDPYLDKEKAMAMVIEHYHGSDGKRNVYSEDGLQRPNWMDGAFNEGAWLDHFVKELPEQVAQAHEMTGASDGEYVDQQSVKGKLFELDTDGNVVYDNGMPVIKATPATVEAALQDSRFKRHVQAEKQRPENTGRSVYEVVAQKLEPFGYANVTNERKKGFSKDDDSGSSRAKAKQELVLGRVEVVERIQKNVEAQWQILKGGELPNGETVEEVAYDVTNSQLVFNGGDAFIDISAKNNGGFSEIWNMLNTVRDFDPIDISEIGNHPKYVEKYPNYKDPFDYSESGYLHSDINKLWSTIANSDQRAAFRERIVASGKVKDVKWSGDSVTFELTDGNKQDFDFGNVTEQSGLPRMLYLKLQNLLLDITPGRYMPDLDTDTLEQ